MHIVAGNFARYFYIKRNAHEKSSLLDDMNTSYFLLSSSDCDVLGLLVFYLKG